MEAIKTYQRSIGCGAQSGVPSMVFWKLHTLRYVMLMLPRQIASRAPRYTHYNRDGLQGSGPWMMQLVKGVGRATSVA